MIFKNDTTQQLKWLPLVFLVGTLPFSMISGWRTGVLEPDWAIVLTNLFGLTVTAFVMIWAMPDIKLSQHMLQVTILGSRKTLQEITYNKIKSIEVQKVGSACQLILTSTDHRRTVINGFKEDSLQRLLKALQPYVKTVQMQPVTIDTPATQDIGQRVLHVIAAALVLGGLAWFIAWQHQAWHSSSESMFDWLVLSLPIGILLAYMWIKPEKKALPIPAALLSGVLLGAALNVVFLQANRLQNEQKTQTAVYEFILSEKEEHRQKWTPVENNPLVFHDGYVWVYDVWSQGFNIDLEQGKTYAIAVQHGRLNDIGFPAYAFDQATLVE